MIRIVKRKLVVEKELCSKIEWAKLMNNYKNMAEEIVLKEYVFV